MKVFYAGFNLYHQFTVQESPASIIKKFIQFNCTDARNIEVTHTYSVLLVADGIQFQGAKSDKIVISQKISQISCNENFTLILTEDGDIYKKPVDDTDLVKVRLIDLEDDRIVKIACGAKLSVALSQLGSVYNLPNKLDFVNKDIIDVKTGRSHCLLLDKNGNVYSFGIGSHGQLGHGTLDKETEPKQIDALAGIRIESISAGGWHSVAISKDGDVYVWGWNSNGQLSLFSEDDKKPISVMATPQAIDFQYNVKKAACGNRHTIVLLENGNLYGCGWNRFNQLLEDYAEENIYSLQFLHDFSAEKVTELKSGPWGSLVVCQD